MAAYAALLKGINLGGHHRVAMAELRDVCTGLGLENVATYVQSGNVVLSSPRRDAVALAADLEVALAGAFGFDVPVIVRSGAQLQAVVVHNPFVQAGKDASELSVGFLAGRPTPEAARRLRDDPLAASPPDGHEFDLRDEEVYLFHPGGYGRTKLTNAFFDRRLGTTMTVRNWRTVLALADLTRQLDT